MQIKLEAQDIKVAIAEYLLNRGIKPCKPVLEPGRFIAVNIEEFAKIVAIVILDSDENIGAFVDGVESRRSEP